MSTHYNTRSALYNSLPRETDYIHSVERLFEYFEREESRLNRLFRLFKLNKFVVNMNTEVPYKVIKAHMSSVTLQDQHKNTMVVSLLCDDGTGTANMALEDEWRAV